MHHDQQTAPVTPVGERLTRHARGRAINALVDGNARTAERIINRMTAADRHATASAARQLAELAGAGPAQPLRPAHRFGRTRAAWWTPQRATFATAAGAGVLSWLSAIGIISTWLLVAAATIVPVVMVVRRRRSGTTGRSVHRPITNTTRRAS
jgi:hypothetical protein